MDKKFYKFGDILIVARFDDNWTYPEWSKDCRPQYTITLRDGTNKVRHSVKAWGNIADAPDLQHKDLAGIVLDEHLREIGSFQDFCSEFGYDEDSRRAEKIYNQLVRCYGEGKWQKLAGDVFDKWLNSGKEVSHFLKEIEK